MLKRYQVILEDWLADHIKQMADHYDMSFSESIRAALCLAYIDLIAQAYPKFKPNINREKAKKAIRAGNYDMMGMEDFHKRLSKLYFEARKAIDFYWNIQEKNKKAKGRA
jgi:hypothetical protein